MSHSIVKRSLTLIFIAFLSALLLACGGSSSSDPKPENDDKQGSDGGSQWVLSEAICEGLVPIAAQGLPTDAVALKGLPENKPTELIIAKVRSVEHDDDWTVTMVRSFPDHPTSMIVPLHPSASPEGGAVTLTFGQIDANDNEFWCQQEHDFHIEPLPAIDTSADAAATLQSLRSLGDAVAARYGETLDTVRDMPPKNLPEHLYPLYLSAHLLGDADDALEGQLDTLPPEHRELLDRLLTHINLKQHLGSSTTELSALGGFIDALDLTRSTTMLRAAGGGACTNIGVNSLSPMMSISGWSADALTGTSGKAMDAMSTAAGVIGLIPHPAAQGVSRVGGAMLFAVQTMLEGMSKLLPGSFTEADFEYSHPFFEEDSEESGHWDSFHAQAASEGWQLDQTILQGLLTGVGTAGADWSKWMDRVVGRWDGLAREFAQNLIDTVILESSSALVDTTDDSKASLLEIDSRCWLANDFDSSSSWTEVDFQLSIQEAAANPHFGYEPKEAAAGSLTVRPAPGRFGGATLNVIKSVEVGAIQISISPPLKIVEPGEIVEFTVTVHNAKDTRILITDGLGLQLEPNMDSDGTASFTYLVPDRNDLPLSLKATSLSKGGIRGLADAPERFGNSMLQEEDVILFVSPTYACLEPGESMDFSAVAFLGVDPGPVEWSATGGSITPSGRFTAGNIGSATVTATLTDGRDRRATGRIDIMNDCDACRWRASVGGMTFSGPQINISPGPGNTQTISLAGPDDENFDGFDGLDGFDDLYFTNIVLEQRLEPGVLSTPGLFAASIAPGPLSAWSAPYKLIGQQGTLIDIPKPSWEITRNQSGQDQYGQQQALIEGRLSGTMISVETPLPTNRMPKTAESNATIDFVGTFHVSEIGDDTLLICNASN